MKEQIKLSNILMDYKLDNITLEKAESEILLLFSVVGRSEQLEAKREKFCLWYYAQSQPLDANKIADWFASN
jgi:hypothetical protein